MAERKKFITIEIPILNREVEALGTVNELENKTIKLDLSKRLKGKGLVITLQIKKQENKLIGIPKKLELVKSYIRKIIRKRTNYVEDSFVAQTLDLNTIIKPLLITRKKVSRVVRKNLRNTAKIFLMEYVKEKSYYALCEEILNGTIQKELLPKLKKVYPLAFCDIRIFETKELKKFNLKDIKTEIKQEEN